MLLDSLKYNLLAYDIIKHVVELSRMKFKSARYNLYKSMVSAESGFDIDLGTTVDVIIAKNGTAVYECYNELHAKCDYPDMDVGAFALHAVPSYFPDGYTHESFLTYCAIVSGVAKLFYEVLIYEASDGAADAIASVLTTFSMTNEFQDCGGIRGLKATATEFCECIERRKRLKGRML